MSDEIATGFEQAFRDYATDGVASSGKHKVKKADARAIGPVIQAAVDSLNDQISTFNDTVEQIEATQGSDAVGSDTLANLTVLAATIGLNNTTDKGTIGRVYQDATAANNGDYTWSGTAWVYRGLDRLGKVEAATGAPTYNFGLEIAWDYNGVHGPMRTAYVGRQQYGRLGGTSLNATVGTASTPFPDRVALTAADDTAHIIYVDLADPAHPVKIIKWADGPDRTRPQQILVLAELFGPQIKTEFVVTQPDQMYKDRISFKSSLVPEGDKLLVPPFFHHSKKYADGFTSYQATDGYFWELDISTSSGTEIRHIFDRVAALAGSTPVKSVVGAAYPRHPTDEIDVLFATSVARTVQTQHEIRGKHNGGISRNMFMRGDDPDRAWLLNANATLTDITDSNLTALGFSRGVTGTEAYSGEMLPPDTPLKGYFFGRVFVQASVDNVFQTPRFYVLGSDGAILGNVAMTLEKKFSVRAAMYFVFGQYEYTTRPSKINIGVAQSTQQVKVCGAQFYIGSNYGTWVARDDFPLSSDADPLYGPTHFSVTGRPMPFFVPSIMADRDNAEKARLTIFREAATNADTPYVVSSPGTIELDYDRLGDEFTMISQGAREHTGRRYSRTVKNLRAPATVATSPNIMCLGDSITNNGLQDKLSAKLTDIGMTPTFRGTLLNSGLAGEGRSSWRFKDYYYGSTTYPAIAPGSEAAYLARASNSQTDVNSRWGFNPFVRPATGGDNPAHVFNGMTFDFSYFLTRFSLPPLDYVPINIGTNEIEFDTSPDALAQIKLGLEIVVPSILASSGTVRPVFWFTNLPRGWAADRRWRDKQNPAIRTILRYFEDLGSSRVDIVSTWGHMSQDAGWPTATEFSDEWMTAAQITDSRHPANFGRHQAAETLTACVACREAGL
jgi:hypothetical protein